MKDAYGRADGDVLTGIERAAHNGRRITARRARRQKRSHRVNRGWRVGSLTVSPLVAGVAGVAVLAVAAGAAVAIGGTRTPRRKSSVGATPPEHVTTSTRAPTAAPAGAKSIYVRYTDVTGFKYYMYCTAAAGCGLLDVANDGTSRIAARSVDGVWHREQREVIRHDPCIDIVQNAVRIGKPGDLVRITTTDVRPAGTQTIKGISAPARVIGGVAVRYEHPDVQGCSFSGFSDFTRRVDSPVVEYVPNA